MCRGRLNCRDRCGAWSSLTRGGASNRGLASVLSVLCYFYKMADGGNHTTHRPVIWLFDGMAQPLETERLYRALLVLAVTDRALLPSDTKLTGQWLPLP